jgi:hypothetical protein
MSINSALLLISRLTVARSECPPGFYIVNGSSCFPITDCQKGYYVSAEPTATTNRACVECFLSYTDTVNAPGCKKFPALEYGCNRADLTNANERGECLGVLPEAYLFETWLQNSYSGTTFYEYITTWNFNMDVLTQYTWYGIAGHPTVKGYCKIVANESFGLGIGELGTLGVTVDNEQMYSVAPYSMRLSYPSLSPEAGVITQTDMIKYSAFTYLYSSYISANRNIFYEYGTTFYATMDKRLKLLNNETYSEESFCGCNGGVLVVSTDLLLVTTVGGYNKTLLRGGTDINDIFCQTRDGSRVMFTPEPSSPPTMAPTTSNPTTSPVSSRPTDAPSASTTLPPTEHSYTNPPSATPTTSGPTTIGPTAPPSVSPTTVEPTSSPSVSPTDPCHIEKNQEYTLQTDAYYIPFDVPPECDGRLLSLNTRFRTSDPALVSISIVLPNGTVSTIFDGYNCTQTGEFNLTWEGGLENKIVESCPLAGPYTLFIGSSWNTLVSSGIWKVRFNNPGWRLDKQLVVNGASFITSEPPPTTTRSTTTTIAAQYVNTNKSSDDDTVVLVIVLVLCAVVLVSSVTYVVYRYCSSRGSGF